MSSTTPLESTQHSTEARQQAAAPTYPPLAQVQRTHVDTNAAAHYLNRRPQTVRGHHCHGTYITPELRPLVLNGRLAWPVDAIKKCMGVAV